MSKSPREQIRVVRILEYTGDRQWVEACIQTRAVKGERKMAGGVIREAIVGETFEILEDPLHA